MPTDQPDAVQPDAVQPHADQPYVDQPRQAAVAEFHEDLGYEGPTWEIAGWGSADRQRARFDALLRTAAYGGGSVLDWGCGPADLYFHLNTLNPDTLNLPVAYRGVDTNPRMVALARRRGAPDIALIPFDERPTGPADYVFLSGVFQFQDLQDPLYYLSILEHAYDISGKAVAANFLSGQLPAAERDDGELYVDPAVLARFAAALTDRWALDHTYHPEGADFTVALLK